MSHSDRESELLARMATLRARAAIQRRHLAQTSLQIESQLGGLDRNVHIIRNVVGRPAVLAGGIALVVLVGPKRMLRWAGRGLVLWTSARRVLRIAGQLRR